MIGGIYTNDIIHTSMMVGIRRYYNIIYVYKGKSAHNGTADGFACTKG